MMVVGLALLVVGKNITRYLPPNDQGDEGDEFLQLLQSVGKLLRGVGIAILVIGLVCLAC